MIERFRLWLRAWFGIEKDQDNMHQVLMDHGAAVTQDFNNLQDQIIKLRNDIARVEIAQYVPPQQEEPKPKVIPTRTMREFNAILDREFEQEEQNALR